LPQGEGTPFHPFPIVPPTVGIMGAGAMALSEGTMRPLERVAPLLVPGGIELSRARRLLSPEYVDYRKPDGEGRVPLYSQQGVLTGYYSKGQLIGRALGFGTIDAAKERQLMDYLLKQRDEIRSYRREYMESLLDNDVGTAEGVQKEFKERFPSLGKITVKARDLDAIRLRRQVTRLERVLETMPKAYRQQYAEMVSLSLGARAESLMGVDPALLQDPRMTIRRRKRVNPPRLGGGAGGAQMAQQPQRGQPTLGVGMTGLPNLGGF